MHDLWLKHEQKFKLAMPQILLDILNFIPKNLTWSGYDETIGNELIRENRVMLLCKM